MPLPLQLLFILNATGYFLQEKITIPLFITEARKNELYVKTNMLKVFLASFLNFCFRSSLFLFCFSWFRAVNGRLKGSH